MHVQAGLFVLPADTWQDLQGHLNVKVLQLQGRPQRLDKDSDAGQCLQKAWQNYKISRGQLATLQSGQLLV